MFQKMFFIFFSLAVISAAGCSAGTKCVNIRSNLPEVKPLVKEQKKNFSYPLITKLHVEPSVRMLYPGGSYQFKAKGYDSSGNIVEITPIWKITSEVSDFGTIDKPEGSRVIFSAEHSGKGKLTAEYNDIQTSSDIEILYKDGEATGGEGSNIKS